MGNTRFGCLRVYVQCALAFTFLVFQPIGLEAQSSRGCTTSAEIIAGVNRQTIGCSQAGIVQQLFLEENAAFGFFLNMPEVEGFAAIKTFALYDRNIGIDKATDPETEEMRDGILSYVSKVKWYEPKTRSLLYQMYLVLGYHQFKHGALPRDELDAKIRLEKLPLMRGFAEAFSSYQIVVCFVEVDIYDVEMEITLSSDRFEDCIKEGGGD